MAAIQIPRAVQLFETLQILSFIIGLIHGAIIFDLGLWDGIFAFAPILILTLLISRKRKQWARWVLAILFVGGLALMVAMPPIFFGQGYPMVTIIVTLFQGAGLALIFTKPASLWLNMPQ
jgi:hypothetical protein